MLHPIDWSRYAYGPTKGYTQSLRSLCVLLSTFTPLSLTCIPGSVRKVRCDGNSPCARCIAASWDCTYLKTHGKSGPKGPRRTTEAAIRRLQERSRLNTELLRSDSDTSYDDNSPVTAEFPLLDSLPPVTKQEPDSLVGWPDIVSPTFGPASKKSKRISTSSISHYLEVYQARGYVIWPIADTEALVARLLTHPEDMEAYGLACAICAATISQFQIDAEPGSPVEGHYRISSGLFESEAKRGRKLSDHLEHVTIWSLMSSFFLHVYSANIGRMSASTILLGEAITKAHMIGLHRLSYYEPMGIEQMQHNLRVYWLLFITERYAFLAMSKTITNQRQSSFNPTRCTDDAETRSRTTSIRGSP